MLDMAELDDTNIDAEITRARGEFRIEELSLQMRKKKAVLDYLVTNKGKPIGHPEHVGYGRIAKRNGITYEQLRNALREEGEK